MNLWRCLIIFMGLSLLITLMNLKFKILYYRIIIPSYRRKILRILIYPKRHRILCLTNDHKPKNKFGPQSKNLASIIRGFKIGVTKSARLINPDFAWQPRYHDHIIRDEKAYENISNYIRNNPKNWSKDKFHQ